MIFNNDVMNKNISLNVKAAQKSNESQKGSQDRRIPIFHSIHCDPGACGYYRSKFINATLSQLYKDIYFIESQILPCSEKELRFCRSLRLQRLHTKLNLKWFDEFLMPIRKALGFKILFDLDDILVPDDMPPYNIYRDLFRHAPETLPVFLEKSDVVTVSTPQIRDYYSGKFGIAPEKFKILPNYLPRFWGDHFSAVEVQDRVRRHRGKKLRIGISASPTHFKTNEKGDAQRDDLSHIADWIIRNRKKHRFVFQGGISNYLLPYKEDFEVYPHVPFLTYFHTRRQLDLDLLIQPLEDNLFNRAKSVIKIYEGWAAGLPVLTQDLPNYRELSPESCFHDAAGLDEKIQELSASPETYVRTVFANYRKMDDLWLHCHAEDWLNVML